MTEGQSVAFCFGDAERRESRTQRRGRRRWK
nr:MAG TPA: deoxyribonuclease II-like protein [Caudoviricetes sp.]